MTATKKFMQNILPFHLLCNLIKCFLVKFPDLNARLLQQCTCAKMHRNRNDDGELYWLLQMNGADQNRDTTPTFIMIFAIKSVLFRPLLAKSHSLKHPPAIYICGDKNDFHYFTESAIKTIRKHTEVIREGRKSEFILMTNVITRILFCITNG